MSRPHTVITRGPRPTEYINYVSRSKQNTVIIGTIATFLSAASIFIALVLPLALYYKILIHGPALLVPILLSRIAKLNLSTYLKTMELS